MRFLLPVIVFLMSVTTLRAAADNMTPYGDYSKWCSAYGMCKENLGPKEAEDAIEGYFASKGLKVKNVRHKGRFVEAEIYKNDKRFDKILFDRKTGRIRSTY